MRLNERPSSRRESARQLYSPGHGSLAGSGRFCEDDDDDEIDEDNESEARREAWIAQAAQIDEKFYIGSGDNSNKTIDDRNGAPAGEGGGGGGVTTARTMEVVLTKTSHKTE